MKKGLVIILSVLVMAGVFAAGIRRVAVADEKSTEKKEVSEEKKRLMLIKEAYGKMTKYYYKDFEVHDVGNLF